MADTLVPFARIGGSCQRFHHFVSPACCRWRDGTGFQEAVQLDLKLALRGGLTWEDIKWLEDRREI